MTDVAGPVPADPPNRIAPTNPPIEAATLRDLFAAVALTGSAVLYAGSDAYPHTAALADRLADEMLAARARR